MKRLALLFILTTLLLGSCAPASASPTQLVVSTVTQTAVPSPTLSPTLTAIPSATPYPPLHTQGPYLLFTRDHKSQTIMDADGSGRKQIQLPDDGHILGHIEDAISPDGKWVSYFTGSKDEPYDLALHLLNWREGTAFFIAKLISPGFPQNLEPMARTLETGLIDDDCATSLECKMNVTEDAFSEGIDSLGWSPNSLFLAFAAQIDGISSDLYLYDVANNSVRRVTKEEENIFSIDKWSPNGEKILYQTSIPGMSYTFHSLHIATSQSKTVQNPQVVANGLFWGGMGWITENSYLIVSSGDGGFLSNFRSVNVSNNQVNQFWKYGLENFLFVPEFHGMAFSLYEEEAEYYKISLGAGTYFLPINEKPIKLTNEVYAPRESGFADSFLAEKDGNLYSIKIDGSSIDPIIEGLSEYSLYQISPDKKWLLVEANNRLELYSEGLQLIKAWDINNKGILWRPDSLGAFLIADNELFYLPIPNREPIFVGYCSDTYCPYPEDFVWLP